MDTLLQAVMSGLAVGTLFALVALGFNVTYVVNGTLNMGQGHAVMLGGMTTWTLVAVVGMPFLIALVVTGILVGLYGVLVDVVAVRKFATSSDAVTWLLSTVALAIIVQDVALYLWGPEERILQSPVGNGTFELLGASLYYKELLLLPAVGLILLALYYFYNRSHWGLWLRATADNRTATALMGISHSRTVALAFGISGLLAGLVGGLQVPTYSVSPSIGLPIALTAVAVAIVAGLESPKGIVIVGLGLGVAQTIISTYVGPEFRDSLIYVAVLAVLFFRPNGIFGSVRTVKV